MDDANKQKGFSAWAVLGYCWGAKVANLTLHNPDSAVKCGVMAHPAMLDPADAKDLRVPLALLASRDEDVEAVQLFKGNPAGLEIRVETFGNMVHGWMAARADLEDEECLKEYQRGYKIVSGVFTAVSVIFSRNELSPWSHV
jgi:dienelactone hydrolase